MTSPDTTIALRLIDDELARPCSRERWADLVQRRAEIVEEIGAAMDLERDDGAVLDGK